MENEKKKIFFHIEIQFNYDIIIIIDMNSENRERTKIKMSHFSTKFQNFFFKLKKNEENENPTRNLNFKKI